MVSPKCQQCYIKVYGEHYLECGHMYTAGTSKMVLFVPNFPAMEFIKVGSGRNEGKVLLHCIVHM